MKSTAHPSAKKRTTHEHVHVYNLCACGKMEPINFGTASAHDSRSSSSDGVLGKEEVARHGQALISKAVTSKQIDLRVQYDADSESVGNSIDKIYESLDSLQNDVKELGRCLKSGAFAASKLKKVQEAVGIQLKQSLLREKQKMEIKDQEIKTLSRKLAHIESNQSEILAAYERYKKIRIFAIILVIASVVLGTLYGIETSED